MIENYNFLKDFITEPVFVIKGDNIPDAPAIKERPSGTSDKPTAQDMEPATPPAPAKEAQASPEPTPQISLSYKGANNNGVVIIVNQPEELHINAQDEDFLSKILGAVKLDIQEVAIVNHARQQNLNETSLTAIAPRKCIFFGVNTSLLLQNQFPAYQCVKFREDLEVLDCDPLATIAADPSKKKLLWTALQKMFLA